MAWLILFFAGLFEIVMGVTLKYSDGFTKPVPTIITWIAGIISFTLLSFAMRSIPMGTAYAIWTGIGALGIVLYGMIYLDEPTNFIRIAALALIFISIIVLKLV